MSKSSNARRIESGISPELSEARTVEDEREDGEQGEFIDRRALPCLWIGTDALLDRMSNAVVLVTEPGDINRPVALVIPREGTHDEDDHPGGDWREAVSLATDIALNAGETLMSCAFSSGAVIDLRDIGRAGCGRPAPRWLLAMRCHRMDAQGHRTGEAVYPSPFCPFLAQQMLHAANAERGRAGRPKIIGAVGAGGELYDLDRPSVELNAAGESLEQAVDGWLRSKARQIRPAGIPVADAKAGGGATGGRRVVTARAKTPQ